MKKRLIDFTLEEIQALQSDNRNVCYEFASSVEFCYKCKYYSLCNCDIFEIDFSKEFEVPVVKPMLAESKKMNEVEIVERLELILNYLEAGVCAEAESVLRELIDYLLG